MFKSITKYMKFDFYLNKSDKYYELLINVTIIKDNSHKITLNCVIFMKNINIIYCLLRKFCNEF